MKNQEIAKIFFNIASLLETDEKDFSPIAYKKAALALESLEEDVEEIYLETGKINNYEKLKKKLPVDFTEMTKIEGMGARKAKILYQKLGIKTVKELEKAVKAHKVAPLFGFGEKTEKNILQGIEFLEVDKGRVLLGF